MKLTSVVLLVLLSLGVLAGCTSNNPAAATAVAAATLPPIATVPPGYTPTTAPTNTATTAPTDTPTLSPTIANTPTPAGTATFTPPPGLQLSTSLAFDPSTCDLLTNDADSVASGCANGEYFLQNKTVKMSNWALLKSNSYSDIVVEMDAHLIAGDATAAYGLAFRISPSGQDYYLFELTNQGTYRLQLISSNKWTRLTPTLKSSSIKPNDINHFKVVAQGHQIAVYANGHWLTTVNDSTLGAGNVAPYLENTTTTAKAGFDNIWVWRIVQPQTIPAAPPTTAPTRAPTAVPVRPTATPPPSSGKYQLPPGKGGLVVRNYYGGDMTFTINNQQYTVPSNGEQFIVLDPGTYPWSAFIPGKGQAHGSETIEAGKVWLMPFADQ
ncbi:MAG: hypothetical protein WCF84_20705 [Anaerolineae bacterium]